MLAMDQIKQNNKNSSKRELLKEAWYQEHHEFIYLGNRSSSIKRHAWN